MADDKPQFQIKLPRVRVSFVEVFQARTFGERGGGGKSDGGDAKYFRLNALIPKTTEDGKKLDELILDTIDDAKAAKWGKDVPRLKDDKICYHDGDDMDYDGYADHWYLSARNRNRPKVIDADGKTPLVESDGRPYSGCFCNVWVRIWIQDDPKWGKRVNCSLEAVQFVRDGTAFSGAAPIPDEEFQDERDPADRRSRDSDDGDRRSSRDRSSRDGSDDRRSSRDRGDDGDRRSSRDRDEAPEERRSTRRREA